MIKRWGGCAIKELKVREPVQKRAIEKKERILKCGFKLMCEKGYHSIDCIEIAKAADVSTGTVYQYFTDKKDIFLQGFEKTMKEILFPIIEYKNQRVKGNVTRDTVEQLIDSTVKKHYYHQKTHREIAAMIQEDKDCAIIFKNFEEEAIQAMIDTMKVNHINLPNLTERAHLILNWVDDYCHEKTFHKHKEIDIDIMKQMLLDSIVNLLELE